MVRAGHRDLRPRPVRRGRRRRASLEPALALRSCVAAVKAIAPGESAGYGRRFVADASRRTLATCRSATATACAAALTNNADVLVGGGRRPLVGTVSMDNITRRRRRAAGGGGRRRGRPDRRPGRRADHAPRSSRGGCGTINYEVTCGLLPRVPRVHHRDGEPVADEPTAARGRARGAARVRAAEPAWLVGGAVRDALLGRADDRPRRRRRRRRPRAAARALAREPRAARRSSSPTRSARGASMAPRPRLAGRPQPAARRLARGGPRAARLHGQRDGRAAGAAATRVDPHGGARDLAARRAARGRPARVRRRPAARRCGSCASRPSSGSTVEPATARWRARARRAPPRRRAERVFAELRRIVAGDGVVASLALMDELGLTARVLPELDALRGVEQNRYHHADVHDHTLEVLEQTVALQADPGALLGEEHAGALRGAARRAAGRRARPRPRAAPRRAAARRRQAGDARRAATTARRVPGPRPRGRRAGARRSSTRLRASERLRRTSPRSTRHHLRLGFLVHERPLSRRAALPLPDARAEPVEVDVTLLSVADRLATRGRKARRGDRQAPRARARGAARGAALARGWAAASRSCAATSSPRALALDAGPRLGRAARRDRRGSLRRRGQHRRRGDRARRAAARATSRLA